MIFMVNPDARFRKSPMPRSVRRKFEIIYGAVPGAQRKRKRKRKVKRVASTEFVARRRSSTGGRKMAKRRTAAQRRATAKLIAFNRRRRKGGGRKRSRGRKRVASTMVARRRRPSGVRTYASYLRTRRRRKPRAKLARSRRYSQRGRAPSSRVRRAGRTLRARRWALRGNPGIVDTIRQGAMDAVGVVGGEIATNLAESYLPDVPGIGGGDVGAIIKRTVAAFGVSWAADRFLGYQWSRMMLAGGLAAVIKRGARGVVDSLPDGAIKGAFSSALSGDELGSYLGSYPQALALPGMGSYPEPVGVGDYYDEQGY